VVTGKGLSRQNCHPHIVFLQQFRLFLGKTPTRIRNNKQKSGSFRALFAGGEKKKTSPCENLPKKKKTPPEQESGFSPTRGGGTC